jgi:hypothetical protein
VAGKAPPGQDWVRGTVAFVACLWYAQGHSSPQAVACSHGTVPGGELCLDQTFTREGAAYVFTCSAPPNNLLQRTGLSVTHSLRSRTSSGVRRWTPIRSADARSLVRREHYSGEIP